MNAIRIVAMIVLANWVCGCTQKAEQARPAGAAPEAPAAVPAEAALANAPAAPVTTAPEVMMYKTIQPGREKATALNRDGASRNATLAAAGDKPAQAVKSVYQYAAKVQATRTIKKSLDPSIESSGQLLVWIGQPGYEPPTQTSMETATGTLPSTGSEALTAKIKPVFPDNASAFAAEPQESACQKVEPQGTEVSFKLIPKMLGEFRVGASVDLFGKNDCTGAIITRTAKPILVKVIVGLPPDSIYQEIWTTFMKFFSEILTVFTALLLFLLRNRLKKLFPGGSDS